MKKRGKVIVFEGIDQSGKGTQSKLFVDRLIKEEFAVKYIHFHDVNTPIGQEIQSFLEGKKMYSPLVRQLLFTANRYERLEDLKTMIEENDYIVIDRYIPSGLAYGMVNGIDLEWMINTESLLPQPDLVVLIDIRSEVSKQRKDYEMRDVYERDLVFLEKVRKAYLQLAKQFNWLVINGDNTMNQVSEEIWTKVIEI